MNENTQNGTRHVHCHFTIIELAETVGKKNKNSLNAIKENKWITRYFSEIAVIYDNWFNDAWLIVLERCKVDEFWWENFFIIYGKDTTRINSE